MQNLILRSCSLATFISFLREKIDKIEQIKVLRVAKAIRDSDMSLPICNKWDLTCTRAQYYIRKYLGIELEPKTKKITRKSLNSNLLLIYTLQWFCPMVRHDFHRCNWRFHTFVSLRPERKEFQPNPDAIVKFRRVRSPVYRKSLQKAEIGVKLKTIQVDFEEQIHPFQLLFKDRSAYCLQIFLRRTERELQ